MLGLLKKLFGGKDSAQTAEAPYKVETPVPAGDVAPQPTTETKVVLAADTPVAVQVPVEGAGTVNWPFPEAEKKAKKKAPAKKKAAPKKEAAPAEKKPAAPKKPRAPKKPKSQA